MTDLNTNMKPRPRQTLDQLDLQIEAARRKQQEVRKRAQKL